MKRPPTHRDAKALASLIAGALCIGFAPIFVRLIDVGYTAAAFWRVALSVPVLGEQAGGAATPSLPLVIASDPV